MALFVFLYKMAIFRDLFRVNFSYACKMLLLNFTHTSVMLFTLLPTEVWEFIKIMSIMFHVSGFKNIWKQIQRYVSIYTFDLRTLPCFCQCRLQFQLLCGILSYIYDSDNLRFVHKLSYKSRVLQHGMVVDSP